MTRGLTFLLVFVTLLGGRVAHAQEEGRFDIQLFRPSAAPRDLMMVQKSEVVGDLTPTLGVYADLGLDPLVLLNTNTGDTFKAVAGRLQLTGLASIGFFDWIDFQVAVPVVTYQTSDDLRALGTNGFIQQSALGDVRLSTRIALPYLNRKHDHRSGFGMAISGFVNLPTGDVNAFAGDGVLTKGATLILDYRVPGLGALIAANLGFWERPEVLFAGFQLKDMATIGLAAEVYLIQYLGLSLIAEAYGYPPIDDFPKNPLEIPAELLFGFRWQTKYSITATAGLTFGAPCDFGVPSLRMFAGLSFQPLGSSEQEQIDRILERNRVDPDEDGLTEEADACPDDPGPLENQGCPDVDTDVDGIVDRMDKCPTLAAGKSGKNGCPPAYIEGDQIVIIEKVHFETDSAIILEISKLILDEVVDVLKSHPELVDVRVEGHTDIRASDKYNLNLSWRRANAVMQYLIDNGIDSDRLQAEGYGHTQPIYDDTGCLGPDDELSPDCRFMTTENRRVVFRILRRDAELEKAAE